MSGNNSLKHEELRCSVSFDSQTGIRTVHIRKDY